MPNRDGTSVEESADYYLDITHEVCPLTFVRTKLLIERMAPGETALVLLHGSEPLANVPRAVAGQGHDVLELRPLAGGDIGGVHRLRFRKATIKDRGA